MTLDEAIKHCQEVAAKDCTECGKEHEKLAMWLTELMAYRATDTERLHWIPCNERLPEQEVRVLLFAADEVYVGELTDIKDLFDTDIGFMKNGHVTHWMPMPDSPEVNKDVYAG